MAPAKRADAAKSPFLAIERDWGGMKDLGDGRGQHLAGGLLWRTHVGDEVGRLAAKAREACGPKRKWVEIQELAHYAQYELEVIADQHAEEWRHRFSRSATSGTDIIALHGPADVLAWGLLWSLKNQDAPTLKDRPRPPADALTGGQVVASFALLMIDHAVFDMTKGRPASALEFLSIAGSALAYATMDKAQSDAARQLFDERSALGLAGATAKWGSILDHKTEALRMANAGDHKTRIDAARTIAQNLVKASPEGKDEFYTPETIDGWLKDLHWKPAAGVGSGAAKDASTPPKRASR